MMKEEHKSSVKLFLLGAPRVESHGSPLDVDTRKAIALLAYLVVTDEVHRRDSLATLLWPESDQSRARAALRRTLSVLRKALDKEVLEVTRESIKVNPEAQIWCDVNAFQRSLAECETHGHPASQVCAACLAPLERAVDLYRDAFMAGFTLRDSPEFDDWQFYQGEDLKRELFGALERLVWVYEQRGEYARAIDYARRWIGLDPLNESAHRSLMKLYSAEGQRNAALRQYQECVRVLDQELSVSPLEETTELYKEIKEGEWERIQHQRTVTGEPLPYLRKASPVSPSPLSPTQYPLIGRAEEWARLHSTYTGIKRSGRLLILEGEAGIGKTRLAEDFLAHCRRNGAVTISASCYEGESGIAYAPFVEGLRHGIEQAGSPSWWHDVPDHWLSEAARLVPELKTREPDLPPVPPIGSPGAQSRFFEGVCRVFQAICGEDPPGVVFIDDLQWADNASLDLLTYWVRRLEGRSIFLLGAWREENLPSTHPLQALVASSQRAGVGDKLHLTRLSDADVAELVQTTMDSAADFPGELSERLFRESEGLPFFVVEYLSALKDAAGVEDVDSWSMPRGVRGLLRSRLNLVSQVGEQILQTAAVIGRSFDFDSLQEASGRGEEETVEALEELVEQGLIREVDPSFGDSGFQPQDGLTYDFSHHKIRSLIYADLSQARVRLLHRRVAQALLLRHQSQAGSALYGQIARHFERAGEAEKAATYFKKAGEHARSLFANAEALQHFKAALRLGHEDKSGLYAGMGDLYTLKGGYAEAIAAYQKADSLCSPEERAAIEHKLGSVYHRLGNWERAEAHFRTALEELDAGGSEVRGARLYADWSLTAHQRGDYDDALKLARRSLDLAEDAKNPQALAQAHNILGVLARSRGDSEGACDHLLRSLDIAEQHDLPEARVAALNNLALVEGDEGDTERAMELAQTALDLCASQGDRHREAALHNNLADLLHAAGRREAAMEHLKQAVSIFTEIGEDIETWQPEIWKLMEW